MEKITTAASVSAAWRGMSDEEQYTALQKMAWTVRRGGSKRGAEWIQTQDDAMNVAAEAWLRMGAALERNERADEPRPLNLILYSACAQAANTIARREKRYFSATASLTMEDGEMTDLFDMNAVHVLPAPDPEENAVQRDLLARLYHDSRTNADFIRVYTDKLSCFIIYICIIRSDIHQILDRSSGLIDRI